MNAAFVYVHAFHNLARYILMKALLTYCTAACRDLTSVVQNSKVVARIVQQVFIHLLVMNELFIRIAKCRIIVPDE